MLIGIEEIADVAAEIEDTADAGGYGGEVKKDGVVAFADGIGNGGVITNFVGMLMACRDVFGSRGLSFGEGRKGAAVGESRLEEGFRPTSRPEAQNKPTPRCAAADPGEKRSRGADLKKAPS
jgi:hypothetical protein